MKRLLRAGLLRGALCMTSLVAFGAVACSGDENGTDIEVGGKTGTAGGAGKSTQASAGKSNTLGGTMSGDSGAADGGTTDGGATGGVGGGTSGSAPGGAAGAMGNAGTGGAAGSAGNGGAGSSAGSGGSAGAAGNAGNSGAAGTAGTSGSAAMAGNGGTGGTAGTAGNGGSVGQAGSGGTGGGTQDCGNGTIDGGEECDDSGPSRLCSDACESVSTQACVDCEQAGDCFASSDNCKGPLATPFTPAQVAICYDVLQCVQDSNCLDAPSGTLGKCYCGTLDTAACGAAPFNLTQPGAPNGPCAELMQLGNPQATSNSHILGGLTTKSRPGGAAGQRLNCQRTSADPACAAICGLE